MYKTRKSWLKHSPQGLTFQCVSPCFSKAFFVDLAAEKWWLCVNSTGHKPLLSLLLFGWGGAWSLLEFFLFIPSLPPPPPQLNGVAQSSVSHVWQNSGPPSCSLKERFIHRQAQGVTCNLWRLTRRQWPTSGLAKWTKCKGIRLSAQSVKRQRIPQVIKGANTQTGSLSSCSCYQVLCLVPWGKGLVSSKN